MINQFNPDMWEPYSLKQDANIKNNAGKVAYDFHQGQHIIKAMQRVRPDMSDHL